MSKQIEALKLALEALEGFEPNTVIGRDAELLCHAAITAIREALADSALDRMAENAREIGLDYGPIVERVEDSIGMGNGAWDRVEPKELAKAFHEALAEQPAQQQEPLDKNGSPCSEFWDWLPKAYNFEGAGNFTKYNMEVAFLAGKQSASAQEPVAWADINALTEQFNSVNCGTAYRLPGEGRQPLYTSPQPSKPWVGLSTDEIYDMYNEPRSDAEMVEFARAIEAKLREKNA